MASMCANSISTFPLFIFEQFVTFRINRCKRFHDYNRMPGTVWDKTPAENELKIENSCLCHRDHCENNKFVINNSNIITLVF